MFCQFAISRLINYDSLIRIIKGVFMEYQLTVSHSASSYGVPVLVIDDHAYGALDVLPNGEIAFYFVQKTNDALKEKFLKSSPDLYFNL